MQGGNILIENDTFECELKQKVRLFSFLEKGEGTQRDVNLVALVIRTGSV